MDLDDLPSPPRVSQDEFRGRRQRVADAARCRDLDGILVLGRSSGTLDNMGNVHWLTRHYHVPPLITPTLYATLGCFGTTTRPRAAIALPA